MKKDNDDDNNDEEDEGGDWLAFLRRGRRAMVANIGLGAVEVQRMPWWGGGSKYNFRKKELNLDSRKSWRKHSNEAKA